MDTQNESTINDEVIEEDLTAAEVLERIQEAWLNEYFAPEILPHKVELIECMLGQLHYMENNLKKVQKNELSAVIHQLEINRIRYVITSYMRTRLYKIETFTKPILEAEENRAGDPYLSVEESRFAQEFVAHQELLFRNNGMKYMSSNVQDMDWKEMSIKPNLNTHVFLKVKEDVEGVIINNEIVDLKKDSQHIMPYAPIANLVKNNKVNLM